MALDPASFVVHDVSRFPVVHARAEAIQPGYAGQWSREMDALLAQDETFVVVMAGNEAAETHEDRKQRGLWLKRNRQALGRTCLALVGIEPDGLKRAALRLQAAMAVKAFGIPAEIVASAAEAEQASARILQGRGA